jgi:DNA-binding NarL/FixJ family response regulator
MTRVVVVDDQTLIRSAVIEILKAHPETEVVGEASDGRQALSVVSELLPDVVLMDIRMPGLDGIEATRLISSDPALQDIRVLILTTFEDEDHIVAALRAGASGFLGKGAEPDEIVRGVLAVHAGESLLSPAATRTLLAKYVLGIPNRSLPVPAGLERLTEREREILALVAHGLSNQEIAEQLVISAHTAKTHVNRAMTKLDARDRAQLVIAAYESGLVDPRLR